MSSVTALRSVSTSMIGLLDTFNSLRDEVLQDHNDEACALTELCYNLHKDFYDQMRSVSSVCDESSNTIEGIRTEFKVAMRTEKFDLRSSAEIKNNVEALHTVVEKYKSENRDINSNIVNTQDRIGEAQVSLNTDRPRLRFLEKANAREALDFIGAIPGINSNVVFMFGEAIIGAVAVAVNGIYRLINRRKTNRYDVISNVLNELSQKLKELLDVSFKFHQHLDRTLTNLENYTVSVDKLVRFSDSEENNIRLVVMAEEMLPETKKLKNDFQLIKNTASDNCFDLQRVLLRLNPRELIGN